MINLTFDQVKTMLNDSSGLGLDELKNIYRFFKSNYLDFYSSIENRDNLDTTLDKFRKFLETNNE